ncbi:MAG: sterol desaturase family protein [Myxococcales bacterium]|nr:sterol desaturase family protein [Myxococcales bacterium]
MDPATLYVRYLLAPTTLAAAAATLALLLARLAGPLGDHGPTAALVGALAVSGGWIVIWEQLRPAAGVWARRSPRQRRGDLGYVALTSAGVVACARLLTWIGGHAGAPGSSAPLAAWPLALQVLLTVVSAELITYLLHWASHRSVAWLWRLHAIHHRPEGLSLRSGSRVHPLENLYTLLALTPAAALGASPEAIVASLAYQLVVGALQHADLDIRLGALNWLVPGPEMHRIHHHIDGAVARNYALNLPALDLLFGTTAACHGPGEVRMGVAGERD